MQEKANGDTPLRKGVRLGNAKEVRRELARLYVEARSGLIEPQIATKLAHILELLRRSLETDELEQRLVTLELALGGVK